MAHRAAGLECIADHSADRAFLFPQVIFTSARTFMPDLPILDCSIFLNARLPWRGIDHVDVLVSALFGFLPINGLAAELAVGGFRIGQRNPLRGVAVVAVRWIHVIVLRITSSCTYYFAIITLPSASSVVKTGFVVAAPGCVHGSDLLLRRNYGCSRVASPS